MTVTIAICTYNRSAFLARALDALVAEPEIGEWSEILVIDNNSGDDTAAVASTYAARHGFVRYLHEPNQGLSHARNAAYQASEAEYVAYLDDDAVVEASWLRALFDGIEHSGRAGALGGPIFPDFETPPPPWFDPEYVTRRFGKAEGPLGPLFVRQGFSGGNMVIRRDLLLELGGFDPALGMAGNRVHFGEESDFFQRLYAGYGNQTYYAPRMAIRHFEAAHKQAPRYLARRVFASGQLFTEGVARADGTSRAALLGAAKAVKQFGEGVLRLPLALVRPREAFRAGRNLVTAAGAGWGLVRILARRGRA